MNTNIKGSVFQQKFAQTEYRRSLFAVASVVWDSKAGMSESSVLSASGI